MSLRRFVDFPWVQKSIGIVAAEYLRFVRRTCTFGIDPPDFYARVRPELPAIVAMWHGQHFMMPFLKRKEHLVKVLISRHRDGEINAIAADRLGVEPIRGSGSRGRDFLKKGGVAGFKQMLEALAAGYNVALTADIPKISRIAGRGIVELARVSGRPIYPVAVATSRYVELNSWDRSVLNLPFGRFAVAVGEPVRVGQSADATAVEQARRLVETRLNATTERAHAIAEGRAKDFIWGHAGGRQLA
ncbi:MAG TPA: lysophospholipid acyltransferase family protein [Xanthobacteraceae bacterium]|nr:lysophospholipid acyltransferase family protein [Xanthobacteraceae bacterium]